MEDRFNVPKSIGVIAACCFLLFYLLLFAPFLYGLTYYFFNISDDYVISAIHSFPIALCFSLCLSIPLSAIVKDSVGKLSYFYRFLVAYSLVPIPFWVTFFFLDIDVETLAHHAAFASGNFLFLLTVLAIHRATLIEFVKKRVSPGVFAILMLLAFTLFNLFYLRVNHQGASVSLFVGLLVLLCWQLIAYVKARRRNLFFPLLSVSACSLIVLAVLAVYSLSDLLRDDQNEGASHDYLSMHEPLIDSEDDRLDQSDSFAEPEEEDQLEENELAFQGLHAVFSSSCSLSIDKDAKGMTMHTLNESDFHEELAKQPAPFMVYDTLGHAKASGRIKFPVDSKSVMVSTDAFPNYENDGVTFYHYLGYLSNINKYVLLADLWEVQACLLVNKAAGSAALYRNQVLFNKEGTRLLVVDNDLYGGSASLLCI